MQKRKLLTLSVACSILLLLTACGGGSSSAGVTSLTETNTSTKIVPEKINITIPKGLKRRRRVVILVNTPKVSFQKTTDSIESYGYEQLRSTIEEAENTIKGVKKNMIYLGGMMPDIQTACEGTSINELCTISAGQISLTIDSSVHSALEELEAEFDDIEDEKGILPLNTVLPIGKILYTQFDNNHTYQQDAVVDLKPTFSDLNITVTKLLETIRWSEDNKSIETISDVDDEFGTFYMHLTYAKKDDNSSFMRINNEFTNPAVDGFAASKGQFSITLQELNDVNKTVKITSSGKYSDGTFNDSFNSSGQISSNGGYLNSTGTFDGNSNYAEKETFDTNGSLLQSKYCDESVGENCSITDESTWHTFDDDLGIDDDNFSEEEFQNDNSNSTDSTELIVTGGTFIDGICEILPSDFSLTLDKNLFESSIGNIFKFENEQKGVLYDSDFKNQLGTLKIFCVNNQGNIAELSEENRPLLTINNGDNE